MSKITKFIFTLYRRLLSFFPTKLPIGLNEFENYTTTLCSDWNIPNLTSYKNALATMIMHLPQTQSHKSKYYFVKVIRKSQANQVAYEMIQKYREEEKLRAATPTEINGEVVAHEENKPKQLQPAV